jgi:DNA-binding transcriptional ArsR family regulator
VNEVEKLQALDLVCDAIAHPARRQILLAIHLRGSMTAGDIAARFDHAWATTTRHVRVLEHAGLLRHSRSGRHHIYEVERDRLGLVTEWLGWFEQRPGTSTT